MDMKILNRAELDYLLNGPLDETDVGMTGTNVGTPSGGMSADDKKKSPPDEAALATLAGLQRLFGDGWARLLEQRLRTPVHVRLEECALREYGEYVFGLERPTTFQVLRAAPFDDAICLEMSPSIVFPMFDRLLGGALRSDPIARRPLTEIELRLLSRITHWLMGAMADAWSDSLGLAMSVETVECNPRVVRCFEPGVQLAVCHFDVDLRFARGPMRMAFSCDSLAELDELIQRQRRGELPDVSRADDTRYKLYDDHAELAVVLAEMSCSLSQVADLHIGDILQTDTLTAAAAQVRVDDETIYLARPGQYHGKRAFRIEQRVLDESG